MTPFYLSYTNNPDFTTLRNAIIDYMANKVIKSLARRAEPANPKELREEAGRCVVGEKEAYIRGYSKRTNLDRLTTDYEKTHRKNKQLVNINKEML